MGVCGRKRPLKNRRSGYIQSGRERIKVVKHGVDREEKDWRLVLSSSVPLPRHKTRHKKDSNFSEFEGNTENMLQHNSILPRAQPVNIFQVPCFKMLIGAEAI